MKHHKKAVHERILDFQCETCFAKFTKKTDLIRHGVSCCRCHKCKTQFFSISELCKHRCPGKEINEPVSKRSKHDDTSIVDNVPTNLSNQATGGVKFDLKPQNRKIARKPGQRTWKQRSKRN